MSDEDELTKAVMEHSGWISPIVAALGVWIIKKLLSSQYAALIEEHREMKDSVSKLVTDMAAVKAIIKERSPNGAYTWPGDNR